MCFFKIFIFSCSLASFYSSSPEDRDPLPL
jgi:hypothetical protein